MEMDDALFPVNADLTSILEPQVNIAAASVECQGDGTTCAECGKVFTHQFYFSNHIATHAAEKTFPVAGQCAVCGLVFSDQGQFNEHMLSVQTRLDAQAKVEAEALEAEKLHQKEASRLAGSQTAEKRKGEQPDGVAEDGSPDGPRRKRVRKAPDRLSPNDSDRKKGGQDDVDEYLRSLTAMGLTVDPAAFSSGKGNRSRGGGSGARRGRFGGRARGGEGRGKTRALGFEALAHPRPKKPSPKYDYMDVDILLSDDLEIMPRSGKDTRAQRLRQRLDRISGDVKVKVEAGAEVKVERQSDDQQDGEKDLNSKVKGGADGDGMTGKSVDAREKSHSDEEEIIILKTETPRPAPAVKKPAPAVKKLVPVVKKPAVTPSVPPAVFNGRGYPRAGTSTARSRQRGQGARHHVAFQPPGIDGGVTAMTFEGSGIDRLRKEARDYVERMLNSAPGEMVAPPPLLQTEETLTVRQGQTTVVRRPTQGGVASINYPAGGGFEGSWGGPQMVQGRGRPQRSAQDDDRDWTPGRSRKRGTAHRGRGSPRGHGSSRRGQGWMYGRGGRGRGEAALGRGTVDITKELDFSMLHPLSASTEAELQSLVAGSLPLSLPLPSRSNRGREPTRAVPRGRGTTPMPPLGREMIQASPRGKDLFRGASRGRGGTRGSPRGREIIQGAPRSRPPTARRGQSAGGGRGAGVGGQGKAFLQMGEVIVIDDEESENIAREKGRNGGAKTGMEENSLERGKVGGDDGEIEEEAAEAGENMNRDEDEIMDGEDIAGWKVSITKDSSSEDEEDRHEGEEDRRQGSEDVSDRVCQGQTAVPQTLVVNLNTASDRRDEDALEEDSLGAGGGKDGGDILENGDGGNLKGDNSFMIDRSDSLGVLTYDKGQEGTNDSESERALVSEKTREQEEESEDIMDIFSEIERTCKEMEENSEKEDSKDGQSGKNEMEGAGGEERKETGMLTPRKTEDENAGEGLEMERKAKKEVLEVKKIVSAHEESGMERIEGGLTDCPDVDVEREDEVQVLAESEKVSAAICRSNLQRTQSEIDRKCEDINTSCPEEEKSLKKTKKEMEVERMHIVGGMTDGESVGEDISVDESDGHCVEEVSEEKGDRSRKERNKAAEMDKASVGQDGTMEEQCTEGEEKKKYLDDGEQAEEGRMILGEEEEEDDERTNMDVDDSEEVMDGRREGGAIKKNDRQKVEGDTTETHHLESGSVLRENKGKDPDETSTKLLADGQNSVLENAGDVNDENEIQSLAQGQGQSETCDEVERGGIMGWCPLQNVLEEEEEAEEEREEEEEEKRHGGGEDEQMEEGGNECERKLVEEGGRNRVKTEYGEEEEAEEQDGQITAQDDEEEEDKVENSGKDDGGGRGEDEETTLSLAGGEKEEGETVVGWIDRQMVEILEERPQGQNTLAQGGAGFMEERRKERAYDEEMECIKEDGQTVIEMEEGEKDCHKRRKDEQDERKDLGLVGSDLYDNDEGDSDGVREETGDGEKVRAPLEEGTDWEDSLGKNGLNESLEDASGDYTSRGANCVAVTESEFLDCVIQSDQGMDETDGEKVIQEENAVESAEKKLQGFGASCRDFQDGQRREADDDDDDNDDVSDGNHPRSRMASDCVDSQAKSPLNSSSKEVTVPNNGGHNLSSSSLKGHQTCGKFPDVSDWRNGVSGLETLVEYSKSSHSENDDCCSCRIEQHDCGSCRIEQHDCASGRIEQHDCGSCRIEQHDCGSCRIEHCGSDCQMEEDCWRRRDVRDCTSTCETFFAAEFVIKLGSFLSRRNTVAPTLHNRRARRRNFFRSKGPSLHSNVDTMNKLYGPRQFFHPLRRRIPPQFCLRCKKKKSPFHFQVYDCLASFPFLICGSGVFGKISWPPRKMLL